MLYLIFTHKTQDTKALAANLNADDKVITVFPEGRFEQINENEFTIRQHQSDDFKRLLGSLPCFPDRVLFAWPWPQVIKNTESPNTQALTATIDSAYLLLQALLLAKPTGQIVLLYAHTYEHPDIPIDAGFGAMAKTVSHESLKLKCKRVMFCGNGSLPLAEQMPYLLKEFSGNLDEKEVRYKDGNRQRRTFKEVKPSVGQSQALPIKPGGVYIITGGAGGLGRIVARHIASLFSVTLVLVGRRLDDQNISAELEELRFLGAQCAYYSVDISKAHSVNSFIENVTERFGSISGIFHAAGVVRDARIIDKPLVDFREVVRPKIDGTLNLDLATNNQPLDFMVYFSSISALLGNVGQADYSYANSFLDHYAKYRESLYKQGQRPGRTVSINWPLWADGGMHVDKQIEEFTARALGLPLLDTHNGLEFLRGAMSFNHSQLLSVHGEREKLSALLGVKASGVEEVGARGLETKGADVKSDQEKAPHNPPLTEDLGSRSKNSASPQAHSPSEDTGGKPVKQNPVSDDQVLEQLQSDLITGVVEILEVNPKDADIDTDMNRFGFDSITMTTFSNRLATELNIELTPVVFFEYQTVRELSEYIIEEHKQEVSTWYSANYNRVELNSEAPVVDPVTTTAVPPAIDSEPSDREQGRPPVAIKSASSQPPSQNNLGYQSPIHRSREPIAIIGMDGTLPQSENLDIFWQHLLEGNNLVTEVPEDRWKWQSVWGDPFQNKNKTRVKWGGFVPSVEHFDAKFFGISPREAELMDPQHRLFLQAVWHSIEDAGYCVSKLAADNRVGLFCGSASVDYHDIMAEHDIDVDVFAITGNMFSVLVNRISYLLDFRGPSEPVETACSSSMVSVHRAIQSIRSGECDVAIAGGVHLMLKPNVHIGLDKGGFLSQKGRCATFDADADGYVRGEGCVSFLLKPLSQAEADGDHIHGVILGSAVNHGGKVNTLTTPNPNAQTEVVVNAWKQAGVDPRSITTMEAHGTGTALGDPIEIKALRSAFEKLYKDYGLDSTKIEKHCGIGSVKSNIGHLEFAAGVSGMAKILKAMQNEKMPESIHYNTLNPYIQLDKSPFYIIDETKHWHRPEMESGEIAPRRAGVSSFGFGGVNCHVALEEYKSQRNTIADKGPKAVMLSAKSSDALKLMVTNLSAHIDKCPDVQLGDIAYTLSCGRESMNERLLFVVSNLSELKQALNSDITVQQAGRIYRNNSEGGKSSLAFLKNRQDVLGFEEELIKANNIDELSRYWVAGLDFNWQDTDYAQGSRIPLPTYPFEKTRHWIGSEDSAKSGDQNNLDDKFDEDILALMRDGVIDLEAAEKLQLEFDSVSLIAQRA